MNALEREDFGDGRSAGISTRAHQSCLNLDACLLQPAPARFAKLLPFGEAGLGSGGYSILSECRELMGLPGER
jgi:hypothetical protein